MIGRITGTLLEKQAPQILLDVSGVGYEIQVPMTTLYELPELGSQATLFTHFVVREDAQLLYGFNRERDRFLFRSLIKVSGVGPAQTTCSSRWARPRPTTSPSTRCSTPATRR